MSLNVSITSTIVDETMATITTVRIRLTLFIAKIQQSSVHILFVFDFSTRNGSICLEKVLGNILPAFYATSHVRVQLAVEEKRGRGLIDRD